MSGTDSVLQLVEAGADDLDAPLESEIRPLKGQSEFDAEVAPARRGNALFAAVLRQSPVFLYVKEVTPTASRTVRASDNLRELTGIPAAQMIGRTMEELFPAEFAAAITRDDWEVVSSGQVRMLEERLRGRVYQTVKFPLVVGDETLLGGYTLDLTAQRAAEEAQRRAEDAQRQAEDAQRRAEDAQRALEQQLLQAKRREGLSVLAAGISQQLNDLLASAQGNLELARVEASPAVDALLAEAGDALRQAAGVSGSIVTSLGQARTGRQPRHLGVVLSTMLPHLRAAAPPGVRVVLEEGSAPPICAIDMADFQRLVVLLVTNAWEAIGAGGGTVRLCLRSVAAPADDGDATTAASEGAWARLEICDDGPGMDRETRALVFERLFTNKPLERGFGLRLAQQIVGAHGGVLTLDSAPGLGTTLRGYFPECAAGKTAVAAGEPRGPQGGPGAHTGAPAGAVLLVDDTPAIRKANRRMLSRLGLEVIEVGSGTEALEVFAAQGEQIGSVLLDLNLPDMDGWRVLASLRHLRPDIFVVVASGYELAKLRRGFRDDYPDGWLQKPYRLADLAALFAPTRTLLAPA